MSNTSKTTNSGVDLHKTGQQVGIESLEILTELMGACKRISANDRYDRALRDRARGLIPQILSEIYDVKMELENARFEKVPF